MAADVSSDSRISILEALYELFRRQGFEGASIGDISAATGLGRSSLYHHFPGGKAEMAEAVVEHARRVMTHQFFGPLAGPGGLRSRIDGMLQGVDKAFGSGEQPCLLASLSTADISGPFAEGLSMPFADWVSAIEDTLIRDGRDRGLAHEKALVALSLIQGGLVVARGLRDRRAFTVAMAAARAELIAA